MNNIIYELFPIRHSRNAKLRQFKIKNTTKQQQIPHMSKSKRKEKLIFDLEDFNEEEEVLQLEEIQNEYYEMKQIERENYYHHIRNIRVIRKAERKAKKRIQRQLLYPMRKIEQFLKRNSNQTVIEISVEDQHQTMLLSKFPFHLIHPYCYKMDLELKGFQVEQEDFEIFCSNFPQFPFLIYLQLRVDNKRIQYFDCLFKSITKIQEVFLNLQGFRKIKLKEDFTKPILGIKDFRINLKNSAFKTKQDQHYFQNFLGCLMNLKDFRLDTKDKAQLEFLLLLPKKINIYVNLFSFKGDMELCNMLISLKNKYKVNIVQVQTPINMLKLYLNENGLNIKYSFLPKEQWNGLYVSQFSEEDIKLLDKVPQFFEIIVSEYSTLRIKYEKNGDRRIDKQMRMVEGNIVFPLIPKMQNIELKNYLYNIQYSNHTNIYKTNGVWQLQFEFFLSKNQDERFTSLFQNMIFIQVEHDSRWRNMYIEENKLMELTEENDYLLSYEFQYQSRRYYSHESARYQKHCSIIQKRCNDKFRFLVFRKYIYDEIPLPQQVFHDLLIE